MLASRVRRHFRFETKCCETEAKFFSLRCEKSAFFACFLSMQNVEIWSKTKMEQSENKMKKKRKTAIIFASTRNEAKQKRKTAIIFASKRNEAKRKQKTAIFFASKRNEAKCEKSVLVLVFASEAKRKWNEAKTKWKRSENFTEKKNKVKFWDN